MREKVYASDVSREQFELVRSLLEGVRKRTKPRTVDLFEVFCALLYVLKTGCQWRMLPDGFPKWRTVHSYFQKWSEPGPDGVSVLERALKKSVGEARVRQGRNCSTSFLIVDAQSVKNTDTACQKGYDAGKKISGIKRHIAVDTQGLPHAIAVTTAKVTDRNGALAAFDRCPDNLKAVKSVLVDGGYSILLARLTRFQKALWLRQQTMQTWTWIAQAADYHDQMHMIRDFRSLAGDTPERAMRNLAPEHLIHFMCE